MLVGNYLNNPQWTILIRSCRLKPVSSFGNHFTTETTLEPLWLDDFGNAVQIHSKRKQSIKFGFGKLQKTSTDLYRNRPPTFIANHSKWMLLGLDPQGQDFVSVFQGSDDYLRAYHFQNQELTICSPLIVGIKLLLETLALANEKPVAEYQALDQVCNMNDLDRYQWYMVYLPAGNNFKLIIREHRLLTDILSNQGEM